MAEQCNRCAGQRNCQRFGHTYPGYGVCCDCGGPIGRVIRQLDDEATTDRCRCCKAQWQRSDERPNWHRVR